MPKKAYFLTIFYLIAITNTIFLQSEVSMQTILDLDEQGRFDQSGLFSLNQITEYMTVINKDIQRNEALLQSIEENIKANWWKNIIKKAIGLGSAGLGSYASLYPTQLVSPPTIKDINENSPFYSPQELLLNELEEKQGLLRYVQAMRLFKKEGRSNTFEELRSTLGGRAQYSEVWDNPKLLDEVLKDREKEEPLIQQRIQEIEAYFYTLVPRYEKIQQFISIVAPITALTGLAFFIYNSYLSYSLNNQKEKAYKTLRKDNVILEKLKSLQSRL